MPDHRSQRASVIWDVLVLGAGAAGMMAAATAGQRGARVAILDHASSPGKKILISGGGRCNFTNMETSWERYRSENPRFSRSALARYTPHDFLKLVQKYRISWHEKELGQLFCDDSARQIVDLLQSECAIGKVSFFLERVIEDVRYDGELFHVQTSLGSFRSRKLILATGGIALPKLGATNLSLRIAKQFGLEIVDPHPALVPLTLSNAQPDLAGVSLPVEVALEGKRKPRFIGGMVFTHRGISGPAILQISSWREESQKIVLNLMPGQDALAVMQSIIRTRPKAHAAALLEGIPARLAKSLVMEMMDSRPLAEQPGKVVRKLAERVSHWSISPSGTEGYAKAEVMRGGVDTRYLSSKTMEATTLSGLYVVGEAVDVTGWLGGYNFQWAWSSAVAAGAAAALER